MIQSEKIDLVSAAIVKAQAEMPVINKGKTAEVKDRDGNLKYRYAYADISDVAAGAGPVLAKNELAVMQTPGFIETPTGLYDTLTTRVIHSSGQFIEETVLLQTYRGFTETAAPTGPTAQEFGSAVTYARRYGFAIVGVITDVDDDGAAASHRDSSEGKADKPPASASAPKSSNPDALTEAQFTTIMGLEDKRSIPQGLGQFVADVLGRTDVTFENLTKAEASKVISAGLKQPKL